jgi:putative DNA primase/helicase
LERFFARETESDMTEHFRPVEGAQTEVREPSSGLAHLISRRAADITPEHIDFLWPGRLARGKHTAFAGEPGDGKSQLSIYVAATISRGGKWPCDEGCAPRSGNVIIFNAEDGVADTIVPRLIVAGADMNRIHIVSAVLLQDGKGRRTFNLQADLALLEKKIREIGDVALVIIDPISSYMGKIDSHKNSEVRGALEPLSELAERLNMAVLSITHFSKAGSGTTNKALHRFIGSIAFVGAPRAAFAVIEDADNEGRMLFLHAKNNIARKPQGLAYRLLQTIVRDDIVASYVDWESTPVTISADQALGAAESIERRAPREEAEEFLRERLAGGPVSQKDVRVDAEGAGLAWATVRRAKDRLGIKPEKAGMDGGWLWGLPPQVVLPGNPSGQRQCDGGEHGEPIATVPDPSKVLKPAEGAHSPAVSTFRGSEHLRDSYGGRDAPACDNTVTAGNWHRDADVTTADEGSHNPEERDPRDCGPMPECIRRVPLDQASKGSGTSPVCAVCKEPEPPPNQVAIDGLNVWLHRGCEVEFSGRLDRGGGPDVPQPTLAEPPAQTNGGAVEKPPDAVADVPDQAEKAPPAADVISAPDPVPARPMLEGDRRREAIRARNQEALRRAEAELRGRQR